MGGLLSPGNGRDEDFWGFAAYGACGMDRRGARLDLRMTGRSMAWKWSQGPGIRRGVRSKILLYMLNLGVSVRAQLAI